MADQRTYFTKEEQEMLNKHLKFYQSLARGARVPNSPAQKHFVLVCRGKARIQTEHERIYIKYRQRNFEDKKKNGDDTSAQVNIPVLKCIGCGRPIESQRLAAIPNAHWCTQCTKIEASPATSGRTSDLKCPRCAKHGIVAYLVYRTNRDPSKHSEYFLGCSRFPKCHYNDK